MKVVPAAATGNSAEQLSKKQKKVKKQQQLPQPEVAISEEKQQKKAKADVGEIEQAEKKKKKKNIILAPTTTTIESSGDLNEEKKNKKKKKKTTESNEAAAPVVQAAPVADQSAIKKNKKKNVGAEAPPPGEKLKRKERSEDSSGWRNANGNWNRELTQAAANDGELALAKLEEMKAKKLSPHLMAFTDCVNKCARREEGDICYKMITGAANSEYGMKPNVITFTAAIKGLVGAGMMQKAVDVLQLCIDFGEAPNVRTYDTIFRGCVRWGDAHRAVVTWQKMESAKVAPSKSSYESLVHVLAQNLRIDAAWSAALKMQESGLTVDRSPVFTWLAVGCAMAGDAQQARKAVVIAEALLRGCEIKGSSSNAETAESADNKKGAAGAAEGGKKKKKQGQAALQASIAERSHVLFSRMREREMRRILQNVRSFFPYLDAGEYTPPLRPFGPGIDRGRFIFLPKPWHPGFSSSLSTAAAAEANNKKSNKAAALPSSRVMLDRKMFGDDGKSVRLEVGSGTGEWLVSRAEEDPNSNYVALELRYERAFDAFATMTMRNVPNMGVICGDAREIFTKCLEEESISEVFVNFPQPPGGDISSFDASAFEAEMEEKLISATTTTTATNEASSSSIQTKKRRTEGDGSNSNDNDDQEEEEEAVVAADDSVVVGGPKHLLDVSFLRSVHAALVPRGKINILSDNQAYSEILSRNLVVLQSEGLFKSALLGGAAVSNHVEESYGGGVSFFDRLWSNGERSARFFMSYQKI